MRRHLQISACLLLSCAVLFAQPEASKPITIGAVSVDPESRSFSVTGWVNQVQGFIELVACGPGGKTHESVFILQVRAVDLQAAFLLLGLKPGEPLQDIGQGPPRGSEVDVWVSWNQTGSVQRARAESFATHLPSGGPLPESPWIFTGSVIKEGEFKASAEESFLATYWDPWAILNIGHPAGSNDELLVVNKADVPPLSTPVTFHFHPR